MNFFLVLDTSTSVCATAIYKDQNLYATILVNQQNAHSEIASSLINEVMNLSKISFRDLTHLAVAKGPGSYTGLRIGFALMKSLSFALNIPIIGYSTLQAQALNFIKISQQIHKFILSTLDAGRNEIYATIYDKNAQIVLDLGPCLLPNNDLENFFAQNEVIIIGNAAKKVVQFHKSFVNNPLVFSNIENPILGLGDFLMEKILNKNYENLITFEPDYLKPVKITKSKT